LEFWKPCWPADGLAFKFNISTVIRRFHPDDIRMTYAGP
jgi:hypothetical protein